MKATVKFYPANYSGFAPEIESMREEFSVASKQELIEYALAMDLPKSVEYAHLYLDESDEPIAVTHNGVRHFESGEWIQEPDEEQEELEELASEMNMTVEA